MIRFAAVSRVFIERSLAPKLDDLIGGCAVVAVTGRTQPAQGSQTGTRQDRLRFLLSKY
jgi:hypothetical protein